jgi:hypothetical protein
MQRLGPTAYDELPLGAVAADAHNGLAVALREEPAMTTSQTASQQITEEVGSWSGVTAGAGRRGEFGFRVGRREIGHLHGDRAAHFSFPKQVWAELFEEGRVVHHPVFPGKPGLAARRIEDEADVRDVIRLMRLNYDRIVARYGLPEDARADEPPAAA